MADEMESFEYTYSAKQQEEIEKIKSRYLPKKETKMEQLRRLDKNAEKPGTVIAIFVGVLGTLLLGIGMSCTMVWSESFFILGIVVGLVGIAILAAAYPIYKKVTKKQREKIADQILALSNELSYGNE